MLRAPSLLAIVLLALCTSVHAQDVDLRAFVAEQRAARAQLDAGEGDDAELPVSRQRALRAQQDRLFAIAGDRQLEQLDRDAQVAALNAVAEIRALTTADERRLCRRESRVGSHRIRSTCRTESQLRREREAAREDMGRSRRNCPTSSSDRGNGAACN